MGIAIARVFERTGRIRSWPPPTFGASTPFAKALLGDVHPMVLAGLLYAGSGAGLAIVQLLRFSFIQRTEPNAWPSRGDWSWLAAAILAGGIVGPILLMFGLATTAASTTSLLLHDLRQRLRKGRWPRYGIADSE